MYEQNEKLKNDNVWKAYWVLADKSFPPRCIANFSRMTYRFNFFEPRSYVFKFLGALLLLHGVDVALFWLMKPPRSRFCPHLLPTRRPQNILHRLPRAVIENYKISFEGQNRRATYFLPLCRKKKKIQSTLSIPLHDNTLSLLNVGIFRTVCIIFGAMARFHS